MTEGNTGSPRLQTVRTHTMNVPTNTEASRPSYEEWRRTHPPIMGAQEPEAETPPAPAVPVPGDPAAAPQEPGSAPASAPAPSGGTSDPEVSLETPFRIEDVDEAYRDHVQRYVKQAQGALTRKTQELATQRKEAEEALALRQRLSSDDTRDDAIRELLAEHGWEYDDDELDEPAGAAPAAPAAAQGTTETPDEYADRISRLEAAEEKRQSDAYVDEMRSKVDTALTTWATNNGHEDGKVPEHAREGILAYAKSLPPIDGLWPDMETATTLYEAQVAAEIQAYVASKDVPSPAPGGSPGEPKFDPTDPKARLARANAIAGRHL